MQPYIGITDFTSLAQVKKMLAVFRRCKPRGSRRILHVGVMMSHKTLNGLSTKWANVFPPKEQIAEIFGLIKNEDPYYCLHYADYLGESSHLDLIRGLEFAGPWVKALQLDMIWPDPGMIASAVHASRKQLEVIVQLGKNALGEAGDDPDEILKRLEDYEGVIHRVLLDRSMGQGLEMNAQAFIPFVEAIKARFPDWGIVVAGGLGPGKPSLIQPLLPVCPDLSIDAQGKLRPSGNAKDPIDWAMAETYLAEFLPVLA